MAGDKWRRGPSRRLYPTVREPRRRPVTPRTATHSAATIRAAVPLRLGSSAPMRRRVGGPSTWAAPVPAATVTRSARSPTCRLSGRRPASRPTVLVGRLGPPVSGGDADGLGVVV